MCPPKKYKAKYSYLGFFSLGLRLCRRLGLVRLGTIGRFSGFLTCGLVLGIVLLGIPATEFEEVYMNQK